MKKPMPKILPVALAACLIALPALAQTAAKPAVTPAAPLAATSVPAPATPSDQAARLELARKINDIVPVKAQVEAGIDRAAQRIPATKRDTFKSRVLAAIDEDRLKEVSISAMAQTYTLPELQRMYDYYSTPEAHAIAEKAPIYQQLVQPEIIRMMDKAIMEARTGGPGETVPAPDAPATPAAPAAPAAGFRHSTAGKPAH